MSAKNLAALALYIIGLLIAVVSLVFTYTGLPTGFDTEPLLAIAILFLAISGIVSIKD